MVEVARVEAGPIEHSIVVSGRVQAPNRVEIGSVITARVEKELVEEGARVEIASGMAEGERALLSKGIADGTRVRPRDAKR